MFSRMAIPALRAVTRARIAVPPRFSLSAACAQIHSAPSVWQDASVNDDGSVSLKIDKENPLYVADAWDDWNNVGYTNLTPKEHRYWDDLPAPYKYYDVRVDPADVENPGMIWQIFTNWKTALPATGLLALPMFVYGIFDLDDHLMLALITWFTFAIIRTQVGPALGESFMQGATEQVKELYEVEAAYVKQLKETQLTHKKVLGLVDDLQGLHAALRSLKALEAEAASKDLRVDQTNRMKAQLDYLILIKNEKANRAFAGVMSDSYNAVANSLKTDDATQQQSINDALDVLDGKKSIGDMGVVKSFGSTVSSTIQKVEAAGVDKEAEEQYRELFAKKFGYAPAVTEAMLEATEGNAREYAVLVAKCGGATPTVGTPLVGTIPFDMQK